MLPLWCPLAARFPQTPSRALCTLSLQLFGVAARSPGTLGRTSYGIHQTVALHSRNMSQSSRSNNWLPARPPQLALGWDSRTPCQTQLQLTHTPCSILQWCAHSNYPTPTVHSPMASHSAATVWFSLVCCWLFLNGSTASPSHCRLNCRSPSWHSTRNARSEEWACETPKPMVLFM